MKTFNKYLEMAQGFDAETNHYIKTKKNNNQFKASCIDMQRVLGEDDVASISTPLIGTMKEIEDFFASKGIVGETFADWFNEYAEPLKPMTREMLGKESKKERRPRHTQAENSYLKSIR